MYEQRFQEEIDAILGPGVYDVVQENGQRKYGGPPASWTGPPPPKGCEVFIGRLPRDVLEDELFVVFSRIGTIYELRLMMDFSCNNRGFAFVTYTNTRDAHGAIQQLNDFEMRPCHCIGVVKSIDNCRLFIGGIPKNKTQDDVKNEMDKLTEGVVKVLVYSSITDKTRNRGFAFVEYINHRAASKARRKLVPDRVHLWGNEIAVDWAQPEPAVDEDVMSNVTKLYVRNLNLSTTEDSLRKKFDLASDGNVEKLRMVRDFAFVHFTSRESAQKALDKLNNTEVNGSIIEVTWAKPPNKDNTVVSHSFKRTNKYPNAKSPNGNTMKSMNANSVSRPTIPISSVQTMVANPIPNMFSYPPPSFNNSHLLRQINCAGQAVITQSINANLNLNYEQSYSLINTAKMLENQRALLDPNSLNDNVRANSPVIDCRLLNNARANRNVYPPDNNGQLNWFQPVFNHSCLTSPPPFFGF